MNTKEQIVESVKELTPYQISDLQNKLDEIKTQRFKEKVKSKIENLSELLNSYKNKTVVIFTKESEQIYCLFGKLINYNFDEESVEYFFEKEHLSLDTAYANCFDVIEPYENGFSSQCMSFYRNTLIKEIEQSYYDNLKQVCLNFNNFIKNTASELDKTINENNKI